MPQPSLLRARQNARKHARSTHTCRNGKAEGRPTKEISEILCVSPSTVKTHRANIMEKLQMDNIAHLIQFAIRLGIVEIKPDED